MGVKEYMIHQLCNEDLAEWWVYGWNGELMVIHYSTSKKCLV